MFDLDTLSGQKKSAITGAACTLLFQTKTCRKQLEEAMKYEGMAVPYSQACTDESITDAIVGTESPLILIEIRQNLVDIAHRLISLVSSQVRVVLIGREDSITALRAIKHLGFYYLYWPAEKPDIAAFLHDLQEDLRQAKAPLAQRFAKRIAVVGPKGGSGCTMVTCELAYGLVRESQQQVILVDHGYTCSDMHIMLGKRDLARMPIADEAQRHHTLGNMLDHMRAQSQLTRVEPLISYLGFQANSGAGDELRDYTNNVLEPLRQDANFIIEDYSASVKFYPQPEWLCQLMDCVVLVIQPTLAGLHEAQVFLQGFQRENEKAEPPARLVVVLNHCHAKDAVEFETIEQFLQQKVDIEIPHFKQCEEYLTSGKRFVDGKAAMRKPFMNLSRMILGKRPVKGMTFSFRKQRQDQREDKTEVV